MSNQGYYEVNYMRKNYPLKVIPHQNILYEAREDNLHIQRHWHRSLELVLVYENSCVLWIGGQSRTLQDIELVLINSGESHELYNFSLDSGRGCSIVISYTFLKQEFPEIDNYYFLIDEQHKSYLKLIDAILRMSESYKKQENWYDLELRSILYEILFILFKDFKKLKTTEYIQDERHAEQYKEIIAYMNRHFCENIKMYDVASHFGYSVEYFSRSFKKYMGVNFKSYLTQMKVHYGKSLLTETEESILKIALTCGFSDEKAFIREFKKIFHQTPLKYRKMVKKHNKEVK